MQIARHINSASCWLLSVFLLQHEQAPFSVLAGNSPELDNSFSVFSDIITQSGGLSPLFDCQLLKKIVGGNVEHAVCPVVLGYSSSSGFSGLK